MGKREKGGEAFVTGLVFTAGFGIVWAATGAWFWVFPTMFAGVLPAVRGLQQILERRREGRTRPQRRRRVDSAEKAVLLVAERNGGRVTPALAALNTHLTTEKAEQVLERLAKRSYAAMRVTDDGRVEYEFPEFRRLERPEERSGPK